jgi:hypothetical protein
MRAGDRRSVRDPLAAATSALVTVKVNIAGAGNGGNVAVKFAAPGSGLIRLKTGVPALRH